MEQRKGLGRGLASLIRPVTKEEVAVPHVEATGTLVSLRQEEEPAKRPLFLPITSIEQNKDQPRKEFSDAKLKELASSIAEKGILLPLLVRKKAGVYQLIAGERRLRAAKMAGLQEVPVLIRETTEDEVMELALIENIQRQDLNPLEEAGAYQELINRYGYTQDQVAKKVGRERASVANLLRLLKLPDKVKEGIRLETISMGHARALAGILEIDRQFYFYDKVLQEDLSVRALEKLIQEGRGPRKIKAGTATKTLPPGLTSLVDTLRRRLGTQVRLLPSGKKGKIVIEYYNQDDLNRLYNLIVTG